MQLLADNLPHLGVDLGDVMVKLASRDRLVVAAHGFRLVVGERLGYVSSMYGNTNGNTSANKTRALDGSVRLICSLIERAPLQGMRVAVAFGLQRTARFAMTRTVGEAESLCDVITDAPVRAMVQAALEHFDPDDALNPGGRHAWGIGLRRSWRACLVEPPPCSGAWRNLRLVVEHQAGRPLAPLCREVGIEYLTTYRRLRRSLEHDWSGVLAELSSYADEVSGIVGSGENPEPDQEHGKRAVTLEHYPGGDYGGSHQDHVESSDALRFHPQHPAPGASSHAGHGESVGFVLTPLAPYSSK